MITVEGRKQSPDPVQEKLRQQKENWNKAVSAFIDDLIHFKKIMNGKPSKFNMQKSKITEPIPKDPIQILETLIGRFDNIATTGSGIVSQQIDYSKTRKKKQVQSPLPATASSEDEQLVITASNVLTRFLSKFRGKWFGNNPEALKRRYRIGLLSSVLALYKMVGKFQLTIVEGGIKSIDNAHRLLISIENLLTQLTATAESYAQSLGYKPEPKDKAKKKEDGQKERSQPKQQEPQQPQQPAPQSADFSAVLEAIEDFTKNQLNIQNKASSRLQTNMQKLIQLFNKETEDNKKHAYSQQIISTYKQIIDELLQDYGLSGMTTISQITEALLPKKKSNNSSQEYPNINIVAQEFAKKHLRKMKEQTKGFLGSQQSTIKVLCYDNADNLRDMLDNMMDYLETDFDPKIIKDMTSEIWKEFFTLRRNLDSLMPDVIQSEIGDLFLGEDMNKKIYERRKRHLVKDLSGVEGR